VVTLNWGRKLATIECAPKLTTAQNSVLRKHANGEKNSSPASPVSTSHIKLNRGTKKSHVANKKTTPNTRPKTRGMGNENKTSPPKNIVGGGGGEKLSNQKHKKKTVGGGGGGKKQRLSLTRDQTAKKSKDINAGSWGGGGGGTRSPIKRGQAP